MRHLTEIGDYVWVEKARSQIGVKEDVRPGKSNPEVEKYHRETAAGLADDSVAWCSSFMNWVFAQVGIRGTRNKSASSWLRWGVACELKHGCVVVFGKHDVDAKGTGHVGLCVGVDGDSVLVLGGNQRNAVNVARRPVSAVVGCRWPDNR